MEEKTLKAPLSPIQIVVYLLIGLSLGVLLTIWPILYSGRTDSTPKLEKIIVFTPDHAGAAYTNQVNLYKNLRPFVSKDLEELDICLAGFLEYDGELEMHVYAFMVRRSSQIEQVKMNDCMFFRLSNDSLITLHASKDGSIKQVKKTGRRSLPWSTQEAHYTITIDQLEAICAYNITEVTVKTAETAYTVEIGKEVKEDIKKRYDVLCEFLEKHRNLLEEPQVIDSTTSDPTIARFAEMNRVRIHPDVAFQIGGYRDIDGDVSVLWKTYLIRQDTMNQVLKNDRLTIHFDNEEQLALYAYGDGFVKKVNDSRYIQSVNYKMTEPLLAEICNKEIRGVTIHMADKRLDFIARKGVAQDLRKRYYLMKEYLGSEN